MNGDTLHLAHAAADGLIALSCFVIAVSFLHFSVRNKGARLSPAFALFSALFFVGGLMHVCETLDWHAAGAVFKVLTALACAAGAALTVRCLPAARQMFTRVAVIERRVEERMNRLQTDPRYDTPEDREWQYALEEIKDLARLAREAVTPGEV